MRLAALLLAASTFTTANPHIAVNGWTSAETVAAGSPVTLSFEITPRRRIHVYAPGADYQVIAITLDALPGMKTEDVVYPPSEIYHFEPTDERVPVYQKAFTLTQRVTLGADALKGRESVTLTGKIAYQACDDRVCFKPNTIPFTFDLKVRTAKPGAQMSYVASNFSSGSPVRN
jgi:DsbC/DsbD-like thiol-disulfide interchange protein